MSAVVGPNRKGESIVAGGRGVGAVKGSGTHGRAGRAGKEAAGLDSFVPREPANCRRFPWIFARRLWPSSLLNASP